uniref:C3H1-type domain-containing protein n=1 Tax=Gossypium raimondii TaxID=29730 RepID=A0A0D2V082_GOSRA|nr:hypothetical protein B456_012G009900 [Gossypium raimondii]
MHNKKEACRNFQRGSCQYGERCKFLHVIQQQPKSNAFGFGTQAISHQQQKPNPFGFGVQNNAQSKGANDFGNKQSQFKNTWTRSSASSGAPSLRQPDNQPQATNHRCNDPESCKRIIAEDFEHERPLWKLTCYSHWKNSPCDIVGDVSYEELRAAAYDDAKRGLSLQSIIERERNLLNSKLVEFENFLRNPYRGPAGSAAAQQIPFPGATTIVLSPTTQNTVAPQSNVPPSVSSFSQLGASLNTGFSPGPSVQSNNASGQPTSFSNSAQSSNVFSANNVPSANASVSTQNFSSSSIQSPAFLNVSLSNSEAVGREATNVQLGNNLPTTVASGDSNIWLKEKWTPGETFPLSRFLKKLLQMLMFSCGIHVRRITCYLNGLIILLKILSF